MKFRIKVILLNLIILCAGLGVVGFLMIRKNFQLALDTQIKNAVEENNLLQSAIEYRLLDVINESPLNLVAEMKNLGTDVMGKIGGDNVGVWLIYDGEEVAEKKPAESETGGAVSAENRKALSCPEELWNTAVVGEKQYIIQKNGDSYYLYTCASSLVKGSILNTVNVRDISAVYRMEHQEEQYFAVLLLAVVGACTAAILLITYFLTKPLSILRTASERFGQGDYESRMHIKSRDEIGELADTYNQMADAVCGHMEELQDMVTRQEQFVADFTHEVKTPMTTIIGYADMLRSKELDRDRQMVALNYIFHEGKRLETMSMKLFEFIYAKQHAIEKKPIDVRTLTEEIAESVTPILMNQKQTLVVSCADCEICGDKALLKSAFINLIDNARKASPEGAEILLTAEKIEEGVKISVQDFGIGIPEEHQKRIFDEFYMVDKSRARGSGGAGLGLSLVRLIMESHGERPELSSEVGKGTTIWVIFHEEKEQSKTDEKI